MQARLPSSRGCAEKPQPWPWARVLQLAVGLAANYTSKLSTSIRWAGSIPSGLSALGIHEVPSPIGWQSRGASPAGQREKDLDNRGQAINPERRQQCLFRRCVGCAGGPKGSIVCVCYCACTTVFVLLCVHCTCTQHLCFEGFRCFLAPSITVLMPSANWRDLPVNSVVLVTQVFP